MRNKFFTGCLFSIFVFLSPLSLAEQADVVQKAPVQVEAKPGYLSAVSISLDEYSLFEVVGAKIVRINGENFKDRSESDMGTGRAFIKPESANKFTLYVTDSLGRTFPIIVTPSADLTGQVVKIHDTSSVKPLATSSPALPATSRHALITTLLEAMHSEKVPSGISVKAGETAVDWWQESEMVIIREYEFKNMIGYVFRLKNISNSEMVMNESEFWVKGAIAAAIESPVLQPGEVSLIYVVTEDGAS
jgi:conjugal transfer pilus assembly protein TraK